MGARRWGDPERRYRTWLTMMIVVVMAGSAGLGTYLVVNHTRTVILESALDSAQAVLVMHLAVAADGALVGPPLDHAGAWQVLMEHLGGGSGTIDVLVLDADGVVRRSLSSPLGIAPLPAAGWKRVEAGQPYRRLRAGAAGPVLDVVVPVTFGEGPAGTGRGAAEIVQDGQRVADDLRSITLQNGAAGVVTCLMLSILMYFVGRMLTARSFRDRLTGLHNLQHFESSAVGELARLARHGRSAAVLSVDVRRLRHVNDALGHRAGDSLLRLAAAALKSEMRPGDYLSRVGSQFLVLLDEVDASGAEAFARRISATLARRVEVSANSLQLSASIGVAMFPDDGTSLDELLANADSALSESKNGGHPFYTYRAGLARSTAESLALESDLAAALVAGELLLFGQPIVDLASGRVAGMEALARWQHPDRGLLPPSAFIPQAEESGLIRELDRWALDAAATAVAAWGRNGFKGFVSVNLSGHSLADEGLPAAAGRALARHGAPAGSIVLEVTETAAIRDLEGSRDVLGALKALGFRLALDDFGKGYSSLGYLRKLPVDLIKIDRQFTENVVHQTGDQHLIRALVTYARGLRLGVVAEGIETAEQHAWLERAGIRWGQGFLYGVPAPLTEPPRALRVPASGAPGNGAAGSSPSGSGGASGHDLGTKAN